MSVEESLKVLEEIAEGFEKMSTEECARNDLRALWEGRAKGIRQAIALVKAHLRDQPNDPMTMKQLYEMDEPVWVECGATPFTPNGGYYCLCQFGKITTPSGSQFDIEEIPHWKFYRRKPEEGIT